MSKFERLGSLLKDKRVEKGLTQMELAQELGYTSPQFVSNWERGMCSPAFDTLPLIAKILNISKKDVIHIIVEETKFELEENFSKQVKLRNTRTAKRA
jgi:transcriptional regulator with XRE-family HTH domain